MTALVVVPAVLLFMAAVGLVAFGAIADDPDLRSVRERQAALDALARINEGDRRG